MLPGVLRASVLTHLMIEALAGLPAHCRALPTGDLFTWAGIAGW
jgi:hypothetical protein